MADTTGWTIKPKIDTSGWSRAKPETPEERRAREEAERGISTLTGGVKPEPVQTPAAQTVENLGLDRPASRALIEAREQADAPQGPKYQPFGAALLAGLNDLGSLTSGALEATGEITGWETLASAGTRGRERFEGQAEEQGQRGRFADIQSVGDALAWARQTAGNLIPVMVPAAAGGVAGAGAGTVGAVVGAFAPSLVLGVGETQGNLKDKDPNAKADGWVFAGGTAIAALDSVLPGKVGGRLAQVFGRETAEEIAMRALLRPASRTSLVNIAKEAGKDAMIEGLTESVQEAIGEVTASLSAEQKIDWNSLPERMVEAAAAGGLMGGGVGAVTGTAEVGRARSIEREVAAAQEQSIDAEARRNLAPLSDEDRASPFSDADIQAGKTKIAELLNENPVTGQQNPGPREVPRSETPLEGWFLSQPDTSAPEPAPPPKKAPPPVPVEDGLAAARELFPDATFTSGYRGPEHPLSKANPTSWHTKSHAALDMKPVPGMTFEQAKQRFIDAGYTLIEALNETGKGKSRHATGDHWHFVLGRGGETGGSGEVGITGDSRESALPSDEELSQAAKGSDESAQEMLDRVLGPEVQRPTQGQQVEVTRNGDTQPATVRETWEDQGQQGVTLELGNGQIIKEVIDDLRDADVRITEPVSQRLAVSQPEAVIPQPDPRAAKPELGPMFSDPDNDLARAAILRSALEGRRRDNEALPAAGNWLVREGYAVPEGRGKRPKLALTDAGKAELARLDEVSGPTQVDTPFGSNADITGEEIEGGFRRFTDDSGHIGIARADMPQIKAEHRGAMVNYLAGRGITHEEVEVAAGDLKPSQSEFSPEKVQKAKDYEGGDRAILISRDDYVVDGHHQWLAARDENREIRAIRLDAPIREVLDAAANFPSASVSDESVATEGAPEGGAVFEEASNGKGIAIIGASAEQMAAINRALPKVKGVPRKDGAIVYPKRHEAKIRAALGEQVSSETVETQTEDSSQTVEKPSGVTGSRVDEEGGPFPAGPEVVEPRTITATRAGDFYEIYGDEAEAVARTLNIVTTQRNGEPMVGVPAWSLEENIADLAKAGIALEIIDTRKTGSAARKGPVQEETTPQEASARQASDYGAKNRLVTQERAGELRARLKEKLNANRLNSGIDPELVAIGTELAVFHIEAGARRFTDFARAMAKDLDVPLKNLRRYLRGWYNGARDMLEDSGESVVGMDTPEEVGKAMRTFADWADTSTEAQETDAPPIPQGDEGPSPAPVAGEEETVSENEIDERAEEQEPTDGQVEEPAAEEVESDRGESRDRENVEERETDQEQQPAVEEEPVEVVEVREQPVAQDLDSDGLIEPSTEAGAVPAEGDVNQAEEQASDSTPAAEEEARPREEESQSWGEALRGRDEEVRAELQAQLEQFGIADRITLKAGRRLTLGTSTSAGQSWNGVISVSLDKTRDPSTTVAHETVHAMRDLGLFAPAEWRSLVTAAWADPRTRRWTQRNYGNRGLSIDDLKEEAAAEHFANHWRDVKRPRSLWGRALDRILRFAAALGRAVNGLMGRPASDEFAARLVQEKILSGEIGERVTGSEGPTRGLVREQATDADAVDDAETEEQSNEARDQREGMVSLGGVEPTWKGRMADAFEGWRRALQDRYLPLLKVQREIEEQTGKALPNNLNPYLGEELMTGRIGAQLEKLTEDMVGPLFDAMAENKVTLEELETYLYARHAPERNARISEINPEFEEGSGSGMSDIQAAAIMNRIRDDGRMEMFERLASRVDEIRDFALDYRVETGLMSEEERTEWQATYKHYVPLRGFKEVEGDQQSIDRINRSGGGINVRGKESKRAFGRRSVADSPLSYLILQAEEAIVRGETNRVAQRFVKLAQANPDADFWQVNKAESKRRIDPETGLVESYLSTVLSAADKDWTVVAKFDGKERRVTMNRNNPSAARLADAMRRLTEHQMDWVTMHLGKINRFLSAVNTSYNPEFVITNAFRDIQTAAANMQGIDVPKLTRNTLRDYRAALAASTKGAFRKGDGPWRDMYEEFIANGGRVYFNRVDDVGEIKKRVENAMAMAQAKAGDGNARLAAKRALLAAKDLIENLNSGVENAVRLAAYKNAREAGLSPDNAASLAKNLTVNFNRRGTAGPAINAAYLFFNASVQGSARILKALRSKRVRKLMGGVVVLGAMMELLNAMVSGDDDDGESFYDKIPDHEKTRNFIIMLPGTSEYLKIPLPYGYNAFFVAGRSVSEIARRGGDGWLDTMSSFAMAVADSFNPIGGADGLLNLVAPTVVDPVVDLYMNEDFAGNPIMPEQAPYDSPVPDSQLYWGSVAPHWRTITDFLSSATGGDGITDGAIEVSPETLEYLAGVVVGAAGSTVDRMARLAGKITDPREEVEINDVIFARKLVGDTPPWYDRSTYYDRQASIDLHLDRTKDYIDARNIDAARSYAQKHAQILSLERVSKDSSRLMRAIRKERRGVEHEFELGRIDEEDRDAQMDRLTETEDRVIQAFNTAWNDAMED